MTAKDYVVMELFANDPNREHWVFQILANLNILQCFKNRQKTKLCPLGDTFNFVVIY